MKLFDWHKLLESQCSKYGKVLYTVTELAHLADCPPSVLNVELYRLLKQGVVTRYAHGVYGRPGKVDVESLIPYLDKRAYITGEYALFYHNLITQNIHRITCFTNRRHNRSRVKETPVGTFEFVTVAAPLYHMPKKGEVASPEQALLDYIYIARRQGLNVQSLVSFRQLHTLDRVRLNQLACNYPRTVRREIDTFVA